jgi:hypothetical protein
MWKQKVGGVEAGREQGWWWWWWLRRDLRRQSAWDSPCRWAESDRINERVGAKWSVGSKGLDEKEREGGREGWEQGVVVAVERPEPGVGTCNLYPPPPGATAPSWDVWVPFDGHCLRRPVYCCLSQACPSKPESGIGACKLYFKAPAVPSPGS